MFGGFYLDPVYLLFMAPALLLTMWAQSKVRGSYARWGQVRNSRSLTGADVAGVLLPRENLTNVRVEGVPGQLTDHYDPTNNILRLSPAVASQPSIAAISIAAHEIGHAAQDRDGYIWMKVRGFIAPLVQIGSSIGYAIFFLGLFNSSNWMAWIGLGLIGAGLLFAVVTLPVELDASRRAMRMLTDYGVVTSAEEQQGARDVLNSAALTYFAAAAQALSTILYFVFVLAGSRRRSDGY